jgi:hypothetical protein
LTIATTFALALATASPAVGSPEAAIASIYAPYHEEGAGTASWEYPIYTTELTRLIERWLAVVPDDEPDELNDGDWLCQCQDWDAKSFRAVVTRRRALRGGGVQVSVRLDLGEGERRTARLVLRREAGVWRVDNLFASDFPRGLRQAIRETTARDRARKAGR